MIVLVQLHGDHASITDVATGLVVHRTMATAPLLARMRGRKEGRFHAARVSLKDAGIPPKDYPSHSFELGDAVD